MHIKTSSQIIFFGKSPIGDQGDMWFYCDVIDPDGQDATSRYKRMTIPKEVWDKYKLDEEKTQQSFVGKMLEIECTVTTRMDRKTGYPKKDGWKLLSFMIKS